MKQTMPRTLGLNRILGGAIGVIAVAGGAVAAYFHYAPDTTSDAALPPPAPPAVTVSAPLHREIIEWDEFTARLAWPHGFLGRFNIWTRNNRWPTTVDMQSY